METSDQELIAGCLRQDAASWEIFVGRFARLVHWSIRQSLQHAPPGGTDEFCREVFQDFFAQLIDKNELSKLRRVENVRKFLSVMACHRTLDRLKSLSRHAKKMELAEDWVDEIPAEPSSEDWSGVLRDCLQDLSLKERACLEFYFVKGQTARDIGEILGMGEDAVRSIIRRAKQNLKNKLLEKGYKE